jgi:hypothetical protein
MDTKKKKIILTEKKLFGFAAAVAGMGFMSWLAMAFAAVLFNLGLLAGAIYVAVMVLRHLGVAI